MKKIVFLVFAALHLLVILYNNIIIQEQTFSQYFFQKKVNGVAQSTLEKCPHLADVFNIYSKYTGAETGYGYYAPNVSSDVVLLLTTKDANGKVTSISFPHFKSKEGRMRWTRVTSMFLDKINNTDSEHNKYLNSILKSIALWTFGKDPNTRSISADLLIYDLPDAKKVHDGKKRPCYIKLGHYEYTLNAVCANY